MEKRFVPRNESDILQRDRAFEQALTGYSPDYMQYLDAGAPQDYVSAPATAQPQAEDPADYVSAPPVEPEPIESEPEMVTPPPAAPQQPSLPQPEAPWEPRTEINLATERSRLEAANNQANELRLIAGTNRAANKLAYAFAGPQYQGNQSSVAPGIEAQAQGVVANAEKMNALDRLYSASREKVMLTDPTSPRNRKAQDALLSAVPELRNSEPMVRGLTEEQIGKMMGVRKGEQQYQENVRQHQANERRAQEQLGVTRDHYNATEEQARKALEETTRHNGVMEKKPVRGTSGMSANVDPGDWRYGLSDTQIRHVDEFVKNYDKSLDKDRNAITMLQQINGQAPGLIYGRVPAGSGLDEMDKLVSKIPGGLGSQFLDPKKVQLQSSVNIFMDYIRRELAGANLTDSEKPFYEQTLQTLSGAPPEAQAQIINTFRQQLGGKVRSRYAAYHGSVPEGRWREFKSDRGILPDDELFGDGTGRQGAAAAPPGEMPSKPQLFEPQNVQVDPVTGRRHGLVGGKPVWLD